MKIARTNNHSDLKFNASGYTETGFVINTDQTGVSEVLFVNKKDFFVTCIGTETSLKQWIDSNTENSSASNAGISEDFVLKLVAISVSKEKFNDVK